MQCRPDDASQSFCSWRLVNVTAKISKACSDAAIDAVIESGDRHAKWGARCFNGCSAADQRNTTSECYIRCFYANVLGPKGSSQLLNHTSALRSSSPPPAPPAALLQPSSSRRTLRHTLRATPSDTPPPRVRPHDS